MGIGMGIYTTNHTPYHRHELPFHLLQGEGVAHATGTAERNPAELDYQLNRCSTARPVRATPANIIPPSRICAGPRDASHRNAKWNKASWRPNFNLFNAWPQYV